MFKGKLYLYFNSIFVFHFNIREIREIPLKMKEMQVFKYFSVVC